MDTYFTRSARRRDKDRQAATEYNDGIKKKKEKWPERAKAQFGLHLGSRYQGQAEIVGTTLQPPNASLRLFGKIHLNIII